MRKLLLTLVVSAFVVLGSVAYAQDAGQQSRPPEQQQKDGDGGTMSYTGCLTKGSAADQYEINDQQSGQKIAFSGSAEQFDRYVNQTVKATGKTVVRGGERTFQPEKVEVVSSSCEAKKPAQ